MTRSDSISVSAMELLIELADTPARLVSHPLLAQGAAHGAELVQCGWVIAAANARSLICQDCDDGHDAEVETGPDGGLRHRCEHAGWITVPPDRLRRYRVDEERLVRWVCTALGIPASRAPVELQARRSWDLGDVRLGRARSLLSMFLVIGSDALDNAEHVIRARRRAHHQLVLVLGRMSVPAPRQPALTIMDLFACRKAAAGSFEPDAEIMVQTVFGLPPPSAPRKTVEASANFGVIGVGEREFVFTGTKQRDVVRQLFEAWEAGQPRVRTAQLLEQAESTSDKLSELFRRHPDWRDLIGSKNGLAWLRIDELLSGDGESC